MFIKRSEFIKLTEAHDAECKSLLERLSGLAEATAQFQQDRLRLTLKIADQEAIITRQLERIADLTRQVAEAPSSAVDPAIVRRNAAQDIIEALELTRYYDQGGPQRLLDDIAQQTTQKAIDKARKVREDACERLKSPKDPIYTSTFGSVIGAGSIREAAMPAKPAKKGKQ